ncbi:ribonuclease P protein component [Campylobacterota bacterium]|nr:ribonuclease P protein component [Campylobacterota bacterium]
MKSSSAFSTLFKQGKSFHSEAFVCFYQSAEVNEIGFVASKKVGNAVMRNRAKRRMREFFRAEIALPRGRYALVAKKPIASIDFAALRSRFSRAVSIFKKTSKGLSVA